MQILNHVLVNIDHWLGVCATQQPIYRSTVTPEKRGARFPFGLEVIRQTPISADGQDLYVPGYTVCVTDGDWLLQCCPHFVHHGVPRFYLKYSRAPLRHRFSLNPPEVVHHSESTFLPPSSTPRPIQVMGWRVLTPVSRVTSNTACSVPSSPNSPIPPEPLPLFLSTPIHTTPPGPYSSRRLRSCF